MPPPPGAPRKWTKHGQGPAATEEPSLDCHPWTAILGLDADPLGRRISQAYGVNVAVMRQHFAPGQPLFFGEQGQG